MQVSTIQADVANTFFKDVLADIRVYKTTQEEDLDIQAGRIDVDPAAANPFWSPACQNPAENAVIAGPLFRGGMPSASVRASAFARSDPELKTMFDKAIADLKANGTTKTAFGEVVPRRHQRCEFIGPAWLRPGGVG